MSEPQPASPREATRSWRQRIEDLRLQYPVPLGRFLTGALAAIAVVGVGLLLWPRAASVPVEDQLPFVSLPPTTSEAPTVNAIAVHVAGAVVDPGLYVLPRGARVADALVTAGGPLDEADVDAVNLAAVLTDGSQLYVPVVGEVISGRPPGVVGGPSAAGPTIDINTADAAALDTLPGVGPATAAAIIEHRERVGPFRDVDQLLDVSGIGSSKLALIRELVVAGS